MLERLSLLWKRFTPLEEQLLAQVRSVLPDAMQPAFDAQVAAINRVQRIPPAWSEIDYYCQRRGKVDWSGLPLFPRTDEFRLAEVRFHVANTRYRAVLNSIAGHIFDFAITPGPRGVAFATWQSPAQAILLGDPQRAPTGRKEPEVLPPAWREFLNRHRDQPSNDWTLYDAATARRVALPDGEYLILAERDRGEFLLHRLEPPSDEFFHLRDYDARPERFQGDLGDLLGSSRA